VPTETETSDPSSERAEDQGEPADRDERRILALQRIFRGAFEIECQVGHAAVRKIGAALNGEPPTG
jgi:hypothetical protein